MHSSTSDRGAKPGLRGGSRRVTLTLIIPPSVLKDSSGPPSAAISALVIRPPVWLVFACTVVGSLFFPFVISTLLWLNNTRHARATKNGLLVNVVLGAALALYAFLAVEAL